MAYISRFLTRGPGRDVPRKIGPGTWMPIGVALFAMVDAAPIAISAQQPATAARFLVFNAELAVYVAEGLTPLNALQAATLNPAKLLHATDSLGTVAPGKLADLVLLDADPLTDIDNTQKIRAVVANGRYFDRPALDQIVAEVRAQAERTREPLGSERR